MAGVFIIAAARSPVGVGKPGGALSGVTPLDLMAQVLREVPRRAGIDPALVQDVILGCVSPLGEQGANIARLAALKAGFPVEVPGVTLNRMCGSSQQAVHFAAQAIASGDMEMVIAGGVESMSRVPLGADWPKEWPADFPYRLIHQGLSAELVAEKWGLTREALDDFSYESHLRAGTAARAGRFAPEILPIPVCVDGATHPVTADEGIRLNPDRAKMAALKAVFKEGGVITAGNSSQISDGAAALLLASEAAVKRQGLRPRARIVARVVVGADPVLMLTGPIPATWQALARAGLSLADVDVIEINEAFASVVLAWQKETGADLSRVNPNGGAIALGHPLGASGARIMTTLLHELERRQARYGLQTMCIGHGMATATVIERL
ncbi:MAG TPA: thiolase family protein [Anaerolineales bacterium]|nr:thiolase family protein [Anaerolineales bacterium]